MSLTNKYILWLESLVSGSGSPYQLLFEVAWDTPYEYFVPNDDNRAKDGISLRERFARESSNGYLLPDLGECRILEFLIALAIRLNESVYDYHNPNQVSRWFWELIENLQLDEYNVNYFNGNSASDLRIKRYIQNVFNSLNERIYAFDGSNGGLFPLKNPHQDQREVEVWYQMMAYLQENL